MDRRHSVARGFRRGVRFQEVDHSLPKSLLAKLLPERCQFAKHVRAAARAVLVEIVQSGPQAVEPPRVAKECMDLHRFRARKSGEVFSPDITIVYLAQQGLQPLDGI